MSLEIIESKTFRKDTVNPAELGYYEKRPGSGIWYHPVHGNGYRIRNCRTCGREFLAPNRWDKGFYCSTSCANTKSEVGYIRRHERVYLARGKASDYVCVDCGRSAYDWSQIHGTTGANPQDYQPRCRKCHIVYDYETAVRGERQGSSKLTDNKVREIRNAKSVSGAELARRYNVSQTTISYVRNGQTWRHIK